MATTLYMTFVQIETKHSQIFTQHAKHKKTTAAQKAICYLRSQ